MGVLSALFVAPGIVVGLLVGGHVDRSGKRVLLVACDLTEAFELSRVGRSSGRFYILQHRGRAHKASRTASERWRAD